MPEDTHSGNVYRFTISPQPNSNMRFSFTPVSTGEITIDITVGPLLGTSTTSSSIQTPLAPPNYSSSSSASRPVAPPYSSGSSAQRPTLPPGVRIYDLMPSQLQRDIDELSLTEPETDEEIIAANQKDDLKANPAKRKAEAERTASASKRGKVDRK